jgi:hypothetical protein
VEREVEAWWGRGDVSTFVLAFVLVILEDLERLEDSEKSEELVELEEWR